MIKCLKTETKEKLWEWKRTTIFKKKLFEVFSYVVVKSLGKLIFSETENYLDRQELLQTCKKRKVIYTPSWAPPNLCLIALYL